MNERIRQLAEQARKYARDYVAECKHYGHYMEQNEYELRVEQTFAELIIKECISIVDEQKECLHEEQKYWHDRDYGYEMAVNDASKGIKQFFGVEE